MLQNVLACGLEDCQNSKQIIYQSLQRKSIFQHIRTVINQKLGVHMGVHMEVIKIVKKKDRKHFRG